MVPRLFDCFTFFDELDVLELRLRELNSIVHKFVLVEGTLTFSGQLKELIFLKNRHRFERFLMYLGMALIYAALSVLGDSLIALAGLPVALAIIHYGVIVREERYLEGKFGAEYRAYKNAVRRWL